jgi:hypothetical protein
MSEDCHDNEPPSKDWLDAHFAYRYKDRTMSLSCPTCGSIYRDVRAPVLYEGSTDTHICTDNWHWVSGTVYQNPNDWNPTSYDKLFLKDMDEAFAKPLQRFDELVPRKK